MIKERIICLFVFCICFNVIAFHATGLLSLSDSDIRNLEENAIEYPEAVRGEIPVAHSNLAHLPTVHSQGTMEICGSFAPAYYLFNYYISMRNGDGRYNPAKDAAKMCSPMWAVYAVTHGGDDQPSGANSLVSIQTLCARGFLSWKEMPFDGPHINYYYPTVEMQRQALRRKGGNAVIFSGIQTEEGLQKLKMALANGDIFVASTMPITENFDCYPNIGDAEAGCVNNGVFAWPSNGYLYKTRGAHEVTIVGYDDTKSYKGKDGKTHKGALLVVNSWGTDWGYDGFLWIGYDAILTH